MPTRNIKRTYIGGTTYDARKKYLNWDKELTQIATNLATSYDISPALVIDRLAHEGLVDRLIKDNNEYLSHNGDPNYPSNAFDKDNYNEPYGLLGLDNIFDTYTKGITKTKRPINMIRQVNRNERGELVNSGETKNLYDTLELFVAELASRRNQVRKQYPNLTDAELDSATSARYNASNKYFKQLMDSGEYKTKYPINVKDINIPAPTKTDSKYIQDQVQSINKSNILKAFEDYHYFSINDLIDESIFTVRNKSYNPGLFMNEENYEFNSDSPLVDRFIDNYVNRNFTHPNKVQVVQKYKCGGRRKAQLGLDIREGGIAIPIAPNMYYMDGRSHDNGGIAIGPNNKNGLEVEGGEVVKVGNNDIKVFSSVPLLRGVSPAQLVMGGANPNKVFAAQEEFKDRNRINDDGTRYEVGGEKIYTPSKSIQRQIQETGRITIGGAPTIGGLRTAKYVKGLATAKGYAKQANKIFTKVDNFVNNSLQGLINKHKITPNQADAYKKFYNEIVGVNGVNIPKTASFFLNNESKEMKAGGIYIKPSKRGTFTAAATKHGMGVQEFASKVLANKEDYSPAMVKKANFARNASRWKKEYGGDKNVLPELIVTPRNGYNKIYDASGINKRKKIAQDVLQILPFSGFVNDVLGFTNPINAGGAVKSAMGYGAAKAGLPFLSIPGIAFNGALGLPDLIQDVQTLYKDIKTPKEEFNKNKKEFGGNMIYAINGNVKNGLMSARPKAQYGLATKYLKKKNKTTQKPVEIKQKEEPKILDIRNTAGYKVKQVVENPWVKYPVEVASYLLTGATAKGMQTGAKVVNKAINKIDDILGKPRQEYLSRNVSDKTISYTANSKSSVGSTYKATSKDLNRAKKEVQNRPTINDLAEARSTVGNVPQHTTISYNSSPQNPVSTINYFDVKNTRLPNIERFGRKQMDAKTSRELDKVYRKAVGNKEPKSGFGRIPQQTTIEYIPKGESVTAYDASAEFHKRISDMLYNNLVKKYGKKGVDKAMKVERISKYEYGGRIKAKNGKFLKYKNGIFTDPETGEQFDVDPEVFKMYGNTKETGVIPTADYTKGTFNARPQFYAEKRLPIAGSQSIAEKVGLARSGWSYGENPTFDYVPNINISIPTNYAKAVGDNSKKSTSSTPRGEGTKASTPKAATKSTPTIQDAVNKITMDAWKASKTPKIDLSKAKMPSYNVNDLGSKETKAAKAKLNTSSTGGVKEAPWVPQYNLINTRDWLGVGTNLAGHIASYFANNSLLKKAPMPTKPVQFQAAKLKTTHNINPDLANINEVTQMNLAEVGRNTASSNTSIARKQRIMNEARDARNKLYGQKENIETQLINLDRRNRQDVYNRNIAAYNDWLNKTYIAKSNNLIEKQRNLSNLISGIPMAVNTMLGTIENRKSTNDMIRAIAAANPNVDGRLFGIGDYYTQKQSNGRTAVYNKNHKLVKYV